MSRSIPWIVVPVLVLGGLGWWWYSTTAPGPAPAEEETGSIPAAEEEGELSSGTPVSAYTVRYTSEGFSPATLTVPLGTTVTFINQGGGEMWVGSDEHPTHRLYAGTTREQHCAGGAPSATAFDQCGVGSTYSFTFGKAGTWGYHNHRESDHHGTITVAQ